MHNWAFKIEDWGLGIGDWGLGNGLELVGKYWNILEKAGID